jgi:hypothetical protein
MLIFVFAGVSCGREGAILAEFAAVPNDQLPATPETRAANPPSDVRPAPAHPSPVAAPRGVHETGGPQGPEPTRFGDWERNGRCVDF